MSGSGAGAGGRVSRLLGRAVLARDSLVGRHARLLLVVAMVVFVWATIASVRRLPDTDFEVRPGFLALAAIAGAGGLLVNALEFHVAALACGLSPRFARSTRVTVYGTAANLLPIPGTALVRVEALREHGLRYRHGVAATLGVGVVWVAAALVVTGGLLIAAHDGAAGLGLLGLGIALIIVGALAVRGAARSGSRLLPVVIAVAFLSVCLTSVRMWFVVQAMGYDASVPQAAALACAGVLTSALGILPGGALGLREVVSALFASLSGLPGSVGALAAVVDRLVLLGVLGVALVVASVTGGRRRFDSEATDSASSAMPPL